MSIGVLHGQSGGAGLAVKVVGGLQKPSNAKQGVIWVKTDQKITGWTMQVEEPTEPTEGMVWIVNLSPARLNALKKNGIWFTPTSAKQYSDGGWVKKTGEYYNNDQWVALFAATINVTYPAGSTCTVTDGTTTLTAPDTSGTWACAVPNAGTWEIVSGNYRRFLVIADGDNKTADVTKLFLFDNGDYCNNVTGGWTTKAWKQNNGFSNAEAVAPTINIQNGLMVIAPMKTSGYASGAILPVNDFDMGLYTKFCVKVTGFASPSGEFIPYAAISDRSITYWNDAPAKLNLSETGTKTLSFSFGSGNKAPYVAIRCNGANANSILKISQMWLE